MIRSVLIDDEPNNVAALRELLLKYCPVVEVIGTADNAKNGLELIVNSQPDLVFLDIEMPYGNAFELLNNLQPVNFEIIFVTAFDNYAINAIKYSALDYLLKPVNIKELKAAVEKAADRIHIKNIDQRINTLLFNLQKPKKSLERMALPTLDGLEFVNVEEIMRLEAFSNYTVIHTSTKGKLIISKLLKDFEDILAEENFSRIHHSHIISHNFIRKYHRGRGGYVEMTDGTTIEVSIRKKDEFLAKFI